MGKGKQIVILYPLKDRLIRFGDEVATLPKGWTIKRTLIDNYDISARWESERSRSKHYYWKNREKRLLQNKRQRQRDKIRKLILKYNHTQQTEKATMTEHEIIEIELEIARLQNQLEELLPNKNKN